MADPLEHVAAGERLEIRAPAWNALVDAARRSRRDGIGRRGGRGGWEPAAPAATVWVRNDTGADLSEFSVLKIGEPVVDAAAKPLLFQDQPVFAGDTPAAGCQPAVTLAPIADGAIGLCVVSGVVVVDVDVTDAAHEYAVATDADETKLTSASQGPARILWRESGSSGVKTAAVLLGVEAIGAGQFWAEITAATGDTPPAYSWKLVELQSDGTWADADPAVTGTDNAYASQTEGTVYPVTVGAVVQMWPSAAQAGKYEFLPWQYATDDRPGLVSTTDQTFAGIKEFIRPGAAGTEGDPYAEVRFSGSATTYVSAFDVDSAPAFQIAIQDDASCLTVYGGRVYSDSGFGVGTPAAGTHIDGATCTDFDAGNAPFEVPAAGSLLGMMFKGGLFMGGDAATVPAAGVVVQGSGFGVGTIGTGQSAGAILYWDGTGPAFLAPPPSDSTDYQLQCNNGVLSWGAV